VIVGVYCVFELVPNSFIALSHTHTRTYTHFIIKNYASFADGRFTPGTGTVESIPGLVRKILRYHKFAQTSSIGFGIGIDMSQCAVVAISRNDNGQS